MPAMIKKNKTKRSSYLVCLLSIIIGVFVLSSCTKMNTESVGTEDIHVADEQMQQAEPDEYSKIVKQANDILSSMTLDEKIYQMLFVTPESLTNVGQVIQAGESTKQALNKYPVGGIIYFSANLQDKNQIKSMIDNTQKFSKIPLFMGVDEEGGRVARLGNNAKTGVTKIDTMKTVGDTKNPNNAYTVGKTLGKELSKLGFNVDFAPVADVISNSNNTEIGDRSFGTDAENVSKMVFNEVKGLQENNVSAVLKHFPGHGSTESNSHTGYSQSIRTLDELLQCDLLPFKSGIEANADFVLISHATFINATEEHCPASLSREIISNILLEQLKFNGIVITDSFQMGAITENFSVKDATVMAINAGVDMILMPSSIKSSFDAINEAVRTQQISENRIDESVRKILIIKIRNHLL